MSFPNDPHAIVEIDRSDGNGKVVYDSWEQKRLIKEVEVELATNQSSQANVKLFDPEFRVIDTFSNATAKGTVKIYLGYGRELGEPVFKGILGQVERGDTDTTLINLDMAFVMKLVKRSGYKNKKDDLGIIRGLVERNKLKFEGPEKPLKLEPHRAMTQDQQSDWDWLQERARDAGLVFYVRQDTVFAKYPAKVAAKPAMTLRNRKDFTMLSGWDLIYRTPENVEVRAKYIKHRRRGKGGRFIEGTSTTGTRGRENTIIKRDMAGPSKSKLTKRAQAQKELEREYAFEGNIEIPMPVDGTRLDVRNTVALEGVGKLFGGKYLCRTVTYKFQPGVMAVELEIYRDIAE